MGQKVIRIAAADKIALAIDLGRKLRIGHPQADRRRSGDYHCAAAARTLGFADANVEPQS
jgi:hypothetical protein